jgi:hypothetical protein
VGCCECGNEPLASIKPGPSVGLISFEIFKLLFDFETFHVM